MGLIQIKNTDGCSSKSARLIPLDGICDASVQGKYLEKICEYLRCEPNDLYEWKPNRDTVSPEEHPLKALRRDDKAAAFGEMIRNIPLDKIDQAQAMLSELQTSE